MKNICTFLTIYLSSTILMLGQVGIGTSYPDPSAMLEVYSDEGGVLIPRITRLQRNNISTPAEGLLIYQTNYVPGFYYYDGGGWQPLKHIGRLISSMSADTEGEIRVTYTDGTSLAFPSLRGLKGDRGDSFDVKYRGLPTDRAAFNSLPKGEAFLDVVNGLLYFRTGLPSPNDWSKGVPFGKGDKGERGEKGPQGAIGIRGATGGRGSKGERGFQGYSFSPSKVGLLKDRDTYITSTIPWLSYLAVDKGELYFLEKPGKWSPPIPFGRGAQGSKGSQGDKGLQGDKGAQGLAFNNFLTGLYAGRPLHDSKPEGFSYLAVDSGKIYFRLGKIVGKWSAGVPFGKGERGDAFKIDAYGPSGSRSLHTLKEVGFTYYATDLQEVYFRTRTGWTPGVPIVRLPGRHFMVDKQGKYADINTYSRREEGFTYYAKDEGKVYFKKAGGLITGWTNGVQFLHRGDAFGIDARGSFADRILYDNRDANFVYYAEEQGMVYFREGLAGNWSRGYFFGTNLGRVSKGHVVVGNTLNLPESRQMYGDVSIDELAKTTLVPQVIEGKHLKDLSPSIVSGKDGIFPLWDTISKKWIYTDVRSIHEYGLLEDLGLYYDVANDRLGRSTKTPLATFDVAGSLASESLSVRKNLEVQESAKFNVSGGTHNFNVGGSLDPNMIFVHGALNSVGIGTNAPASRLHVSHANDVGLMLDKSTTTRGNNFMWFDNPTGTPFRIGTVKSSGSDSFFIQTSTASGGFGQSVAVFRSNARVGIGINNWNPGATLDVLGSAIFNSSGGSNDFRVESDGNANMLFVDASANSVGVGTNSPDAMLDVAESTEFNSSGGDHDFQVQGDSEANLLFANAGADRVGIGTNAPASRLHVSHANDVGLMLDKSTTTRGDNFMWFDNPTCTPMRIGTWRGTGSVGQDGMFIQASNGSQGWVRNVAYFGANGRVGIGTNTPLARLHIVGGTRSATYGAGAVITASFGTTGNTIAMRQISSGGTGDWKVNTGYRHRLPPPFDAVVYDRQTRSIPNLVAIFEGGVEVIGIMALSQSSVVRTFSDERIKKDAQTIEGAKSREILEKVRMVSYKMRDTLKNGRQRFEGVLAQEIEKIDPSFVSYREGYLPSIFVHGKIMSYDISSGILEVSVPKF